jgi:RsiW-degrading membrane proteinase PrsW (M82 family)
MGNWKDIADDIVIIYILMLAVLFIIIGAMFSVFTFGCTLIFVIPGALIIWAALNKDYWLKRKPMEKYKKLYPYAHYPPPRTTQDVAEYRIHTKRFYRSLHMPSTKTILIIFLAAIGIGAAILLTIETWFGTFAWIPFVFVFVIAFSFPSFMWISFVYSKDLLTPEPARNIMIALTWGMLSVIPALIGEILLGMFWQIFFVNAATLVFLSAAVNAPFVEEFCKPLGLGFIRFDINTRLDGLIYGVTAGMGFAMVENLLYEFSVIVAPVFELFFETSPSGDLAITASATWGLTSLVRGLGSTIGHAVGAGMIGMAYFQFRKSRGESIMPLVSAFSFAVILHMSWNGVLTIIDSLELGELAAVPFIIGFPLLELYILIYLIRICKRDEPDVVYPENDDDLIDNLPPPPMPYQYPYPYYYPPPPPPPATYPQQPPSMMYPPPPPPPTPPRAAKTKDDKNRRVRCPRCDKIVTAPPPGSGSYMVCPECRAVFWHPY